MAVPMDSRQLAVEIIVSSARMIRLAARESSLTVPRALIRALSVITELDEPRISDIAAADRISQPTATTLVQKLEERGWVRRDPDPHDARAVRIQVTPQGSAALREFREMAASALAPRLANLAPDEIDALHRAVGAIKTLLADPSPVRESV